jgi:hypothetical protein
MSQENRSIVRTLLSKRYQTGNTSAMEVVCYCLLFVVAGGVASEKSPPPKGFIAIILKG